MRDQVNTNQSHEIGMTNSTVNLTYSRSLYMKSAETQVRGSDVARPDFLFFIELTTIYNICHIFSVAITYLTEHACRPRVFRSEISQIYHQIYYSEICKICQSYSSAHCIFHLLKLLS